MPQSITKVLVHVVFSTKNRVPCLADAAIRNELHAMLAYSFQQHDSPALLVGGIADHIHALISLSRTSSLSKVVGEAKRVSSAWIKTKGEEYGDFSWQAGFSAFSVSVSIIPQVLNYIRDQAIHHHKRDFQDEVRELLTRHGIEFEERNLWD